MIVRYAGDITLMDCEALAVQLKRPVSTIRARCQPIAGDVATRRLLFDADAVTVTMAAVPVRVSRRRRLTRSRL